MTAAVSGIATDRKPIISRMNDSTITRPMTSGSRWERKDEASIPAAVSPPTRTVTSLPAVAWGVTAGAWGGGSPPARAGRVGRGRPPPAPAGGGGEPVLDGGDRGPVRGSAGQFG